MATIKTIYTGNLGTSTSYPISNNPILTKANPFGPTDLLTVSLSSCIATYIDFMARKSKFETPNVIVEVTKTMNAEGTKVVAFDTTVTLAGTTHLSKSKSLNWLQKLARLVTVWQLISKEPIGLTIKN